MGAPSIIVVGSVNLDIVASVAKLPVPGETVTEASLQRFPGGKGANQALAAKRLGADVTLVARVGNDAYADEALALLKAGDVDLTQCQRCDDHPTGIALIAVDSQGENQIVVAPGANRALDGASIELPSANALIGQLEVPVDVLASAAQAFDGMFCVNLAPARDVPETLLSRADVIVVNETEAAYYGDKLQATDALVVTTLGSRGANAHKDGKQVAESGAPAVNAIDTVGAGDTFTAALTVALSGGAEISEALRFACAAGSLATTKEGAQPSLPTLAAVEEVLESK